MSNAPNRKDKSVGEIERDVDRARDDLAGTIEALQERLSIRAMFDEVVDSVSKNGGEVSRNFGRAIRDNPLPLALTGIGLVWLIVQSNLPSSSKQDAPKIIYGKSDADRGDHLRDPRVQVRTVGVSSDETGQPGTARTSSYELASGAAAAGPPPSDPGTRSSATATSPSIADRTKDLSDTAKGTFSDVTSGAGDLGRGARDRASNLQTRAADASGRLIDRAQSFVVEQPFIVAVAGFALGAVISGLLPRTRIEDEMIGAQSDALKSSAEDLAGEQVDKAKAAAGAMAKEAKKIADDTLDASKADTVDGRTKSERAPSKAASEQNRPTDVQPKATPKSTGGAGTT